MSAAMALPRARVLQRRTTALERAAPVVFVLGLILQLLMTAFAIEQIVYVPIAGAP